MQRHQIWRTSHANGANWRRPGKRSGRRSGDLKRITNRPRWSAPSHKSPSGCLLTAYNTVERRAKSRLMKIVRWRDCTGNPDLFEAVRANRGHAIDLLQDPLRKQDSCAAQQQTILLKEVVRDVQM